MKAKFFLLVSAILNLVNGSSVESDPLEAGELSLRDNGRVTACDKNTCAGLAVERDSLTATMGERFGCSVDRGGRKTPWNNGWPGPQKTGTNCSLPVGGTGMFRDRRDESMILSSDSKSSQNINEQVPDSTH
jgi:hypothetical protein